VGLKFACQSSPIFLLLSAFGFFVHDVVVVDNLDERLDLGALLDLGLGHPAGNLLRVTLDTSDKGVREAVGLGAAIDRCDDNNPYATHFSILSSMPNCYFQLLTSFRLACHGSGAQSLGPHVPPALHCQTYDNSDTTTLDELHFGRDLVCN